MTQPVANTASELSGCYGHEVRVRPVNDRELWRRATAGDGQSFGAVFDRYADAIYNYCFRRTGDWSLADDLTGTVFLTAWRRRREVKFTDEGTVLPWLYGVATNVLRNHARGRRRFVQALRRLALEPSRRNARAAAEDAAEAQRMHDVLTAVVRLPSGERDVFALCVFADLSYEEAALALELPIGTVRSRLARARRRLRELSPDSGHEQRDDRRSRAEASDGTREPSAISRPEA